MNSIVSRFASGSASHAGTLGAMDDYEGYDPETMRGSSSGATMPKFDLPATDVSWL